ncbi:ABC transporter ATP-binding protein [Cohnella soli]|uniref:ATP-binding cassette domain-containing protein n=1 Tax=Cohnella soli TaxID=425005 RepID=A0ABW0HSY3_9BACL
MSLIRVENLTKVFERPIRSDGIKGAIKDMFHRRYERKVAVDGLSFNIDQGEMVGYLGPNGAGKSTSIKMLVGILVPTSGSVLVNEIVPHKHRLDNAKHIGVVFGQKSQLWWDIPVSETLNMMRYMYRIPNDIYKRNMEMFADILGINEFMHVAVRQLSLGQRMRADLCASLLHNPAIVYLDEPTIGLDVVVKKKIREFLLEVNRTLKTTVLITTHDMSDVEKLCSRVIIVNHGKKVYDGDLVQLRNEYGTGEVLSITFEDNNPQVGFNVPGIERIEWQSDQQVTIFYDKGVINSANLLSHYMSRAKIIDFEVRPSEIEDVIQEIYGKQLGKIV